MGDHFVLLVDRLLTESTLEAAIESRNRSMQATSSAVDKKKIDDSFQKVDCGDISSPRKLVECRICQEEDADSNLETPCSCCGSLKYAHRKCVQKWCNEKGDTTCEICKQQFKPGYTAPPPLFQLGRVPMNFRGNWEISRRNFNGPRIIMVSTNRAYLDPDYDEYSASTTRSLMCCRSVALIFMVLLILRHALPLLITGDIEYFFPQSIMLLLRTAGIVLPIYIIMRVVTSLQRRRNPPEPPISSITSSDDETENPTLRPQPHIIRVQV